MNTLIELLNDLDSRISAAKISGFWTRAMKIEWLNQAGQRVCDWSGPLGMPYHWPFLELALKTQTGDEAEYYDYPDEPNALKQNSIYQISIEDEEYFTPYAGRRRVNWEQFIRHKQEEVTEKVFSNHNGYYFLYPVPLDGKELTLYGLKKWRTLVNDEDETTTPEEMNEAVVRVALATCQRKAKKYNEAKAELTEIFDPSVGVLSQLKAQYDNESPQGYGGEARSSRW